MPGMSDAQLIKALIRKIDNLASSQDDEGEVQNLDSFADEIPITLNDSVEFTSHFYRVCSTTLMCGGGVLI